MFPQKISQNSDILTKIHSNVSLWQPDPLISSYSKYQAHIFISPPIVLAPVISSLDEIYCTSGSVRAGFDCSTFVPLPPSPAYATPLSLLRTSAGIKNNKQQQLPATVTWINYCLYCMLPELLI